jgi:hypothetical protein
MWLCRCGHHEGSLRRRKGGEKSDGSGQTGHQALDDSGRQRHPPGSCSPPANRHGSPLLAPNLVSPKELGLPPESVSVHLDRGYDSNVTRRLLEERGLIGVISEKGKPAPLRAGLRWS